LTLLTTKNNGYPPANIRKPWKEATGSLSRTFRVTRIIITIKMRGLKAGVNKKSTD